MPEQAGAGCSLLVVSSNFLVFLCFAFQKRHLWECSIKWTTGVVPVVFTCYCAVSKLPDFLFFFDKQGLVKFWLCLGQVSGYCRRIRHIWVCKLLFFSKALGVWLIELRRLEKVLVGLQKHFQGRKWQMVQAGGCEEEESLRSLFRHLKLPKERCLFAVISLAWIS